MHFFFVPLSYASSAFQVPQHMLFRQKLNKPNKFKFLIEQVPLIFSNRFMNFLIFHHVYFFSTCILDYFFYLYLLPVAYAETPGIAITFL